MDLIKKYKGMNLDSDKWQAVVNRDVWLSS